MMMVVAVVWALPATAFERVADPAEFDYLVPLDEPQAFAVQEMYDLETVIAINRHVAELARRNPGNVKAWEVVCQWSYLWWRQLKDPEQKARPMKLGRTAAARLKRLAPDTPAAIVWPGLMLSLEVLTKGVMNSLQMAPAIRAQYERARKEAPDYFHGLGYWALGRLYYKVPGFPVSFGNVEKSEALLETALERDPKFSIIALFLAETKAMLGKMDQFYDLLERIPQMGYATYFAKYAQWPVMAEADALREVVEAGDYDRYSWDPLLVPYPPPPHDW